MIGKTVAHYEITDKLGAGGMGEVYRATDTRLNRQVALKVLPEIFAQDEQRMGRFEREAQVLASLNHPNIASIYGLEESNGTRVLVMELVEGEDLSERIARGPIPLDEALAIARQVAEALEDAHEKGIIHRDLKPANIKLTPEGKVKVLDFGLAKALEDPVSKATSDGVSRSPTLSMAATQAGVILGTAAYMSPEQARGKPVDKRTDIWSFGVVLYEMVTGKRTFSGEDLSLTMANVMTKEPDLSAAPPKVRRLLSRCLEKDPKKRLRDISVVWELLEEPSVVSVDAPPPSRIGWLPWAVTALLAVALGISIWVPWRRSQPVDRPLMRLSVDLGPEAVRAPHISVILSPDGTRIVFVGKASDGSTPLYTRRLDQPQATLLARSNNGSPRPFFSPDGEWIGFFDGSGRIEKVSAQGGSTVTLGRLPPEDSFLGASWGDDDNIIVGSTRGLYRIPGAGGTARLLKEEAGRQFFPQVLPGARAVLCNAPPAGWRPTTSSPLDDLDIDVVQLDTGQTKTLLHGGYWPRYLATSSETGHLIYVHGSTLFGVGFDPQRLELLGTPTPLLDDLGARADISGGGQLAFSDTGTLVYLSGRQSASWSLSWLDAAGKTTPLVAQPGTYGAPRLSPDGKRLAYIAQGSKGFDVWVYDLERGTPTQLTFLGSVNVELAWARDSKHLVYSDGSALWWIRADGAGQPQSLLDKAQLPRPGSFAPDGRLAFSQMNAGLPDVYTLPIDLSDPEHPKAGKAEAFLAEPGRVEVDPAFSPDGKFIAYASNQEGVEQVFVRSFPGPGGEWKVSTAGGKFPAWCAATHELFFLGSDDRIMIASYSIEGDTFRAGVPHAWSPTQVRRINFWQQNFDVSPDGKHVVMMPRPVSEDTGGSLHATFLLNFFDELRRRVPLD